MNFKAMKAFPGMCDCSYVASCHSRPSKGWKVQTCDARWSRIAQGYRDHKYVSFFWLSLNTNNSALVEKFIDKNRLPHLLFYGPPGTGKTSTILAVARRIYGNGYRKQILEVSWLPCLWCIDYYPAHSSTHQMSVELTSFANKSSNLPKPELYFPRDSNLSFWTKPIWWHNKPKQHSGV